MADRIAYPLKRSTERSIPSCYRPESGRHDKGEGCYWWAANDYAVGNFGVIDGGGSTTTIESNRRTDGEAWGNLSGDGYARCHGRLVEVYADVSLQLSSSGDNYRGVPVVPKHELYMMHLDLDILQLFVSLFSKFP